MTVYPIYIYGEPVLHKKAETVTKFDDHLIMLVKNMYKTMKIANGAGLAAPQIGVNKRIFTYQNDGKYGVVINPTITHTKIIKRSIHVEKDLEGCLSFPGVMYPLKRPEKCTIQGMNEYGEGIIFKASGFFARCMQHEIDHLNGGIYIDVLSSEYFTKAHRYKEKMGWGKSGLFWTPGVDKDPFGHDE